MRRGIRAAIGVVSEPSTPLALEQINIVVRDMSRSLAFDRLLGVSVDEVPAEWAEWARHHVNGVASNGVRVEFDSVAFAKQWNPGLDEASSAPRRSSCSTSRHARRWIECTRA
jgi:hypothetical protein